MRRLHYTLLQRIPNNCKAPSISQSHISAPDYFSLFVLPLVIPPHTRAAAEFVTANKTVFLPLLQERMLDLVLTEFPGLDEQYKYSEK